MNIGDRLPLTPRGHGAPTSTRRNSVHFARILALAVLVPSLAAAKPADEDRQPLGWKPHVIRRGDGKGGWVVMAGRCRFLHKKEGKYVMPFGVVQMDNGDVILAASWHDGSSDKAGAAEKPVVAFSKDRGDTWTGFRLIPGATGRPVMLTDLGKGRLVFQTDPLGPHLSRQYFSNDYGRTWPESRDLQPAANKGTTGDGKVPGFFGAEGNAWVDRDAQGRAVRVGQIGWNYDPAARWPHDPANGILRWSRDGGRTWSDETIPSAWRFAVNYQGKTYQRGVSEGALVRAANRWLVAALRTDLPPCYLAVPHNDSLEGTGISLSRDNGKTWSPIKVLFEAGRHHAHLIRLANDDLVMTLIVRVDVQDGTLASYQRGLEAILSHDNGQSWDVAGKYVLDSFTFVDRKSWFNGECGHLSTALLDDGSLLTCYASYLTRGITLIRWAPTRR
jgi:hypothetical protein